MCPGITYTLSFCLRLFLWPGLLLLTHAAIFAQHSSEPPLNDSISLAHPNLFVDSVQAEKLKRWQSLPLNEFRLKSDSIRALASYAVTVQDPELEANASIKMADLLRQTGNFTSSLDWANRAAEASKKMRPLSPARQFILNSLGGFYSSFGANTTSVVYIRESVRIAKERDKTSGGRLFRNLSNYAHTLNLTGRRDSAEFYSREAIQVATASGNAYWVASGLNNFGMLKQGYGEIDSAKSLYDAAYSQFLISGSRDSSFLGAIRDNQGQALILMGETEKALELFQENFKLFSVHKDVVRFEWAGLRCADALIQLGRPAEAEKYLERLSSHRADVMKAGHSAKVREWLNIEFRLARAKGDFRTATEIQNRIIEMQDSLNREASTLKIRAMENMVSEKLQLFEKELNLLQAKEKESTATARSRGFLVLSILLAFALLLTILIPVQRRRLSRMRALAERQRLRRAQAELRLQQEQLEREKLNRELELKKKDISDLAIDISLKRRLSAELMERLRQLKGSQAPLRDIQDMILTLKTQTDNEVQARLTPENIEVVNHDFYDKLRATFPNLTPSEMDLCGLIRLRLGSKEIAAMRNITAHSVRISKYRLKKKLGLGKDDDLAAVLQQL